MFPTFMVEVSDAVQERLTDLFVCNSNICCESRCLSEPREYEPLVLHDKNKPADVCGEDM